MMGDTTSSRASCLTATLILLTSCSVMNGFVASPPKTVGARTTLLNGSFFDDLFGTDKEKPTRDKVENKHVQEEVDEDGSLSLAAFQQEREKRELTVQQQSDDQDDEEFDGYVLRDIIVEKWGEAFDLEFQRVEAMGFKVIYLNVMPFRLGARSFRHATELDYLCHLQAVVEILLKYDQIGNILYQIDATKKKPRAGTSPLIAVPLRLDLTPEEVDTILGP